jgi:hypothetical protein
MSLGDMVNMANAVQQYQQAQQLNPIQLEAAQTNLSRLQQLTPLELRSKAAEAEKLERTLEPAVSLAQSQAAKGETEAQTAKYGLNATHQDDFTKIISGFANDPRLAPNKLNKDNAIDVMHDVIAQAKARNIPEKELSMITAPAMTMAMTKPEAFPAHLQNMINIGLSAADKRAASQEKVELLPSGQVARTSPFRYGEQPKVDIETPGGVTPAPSIVEINGIKYYAGPPKTPGGQPTLQPVPVGNQPQETPSGKPSAKQNVSEAGQRTEPFMRLDKFTAPGQFTEQEKSRWSTGQTEIANANQMAKESANSDLAVSQLRRTLSQAAGSKPGQIVRAAGQAIFGNPEYDTFLKNIAEQQVRQASMMGLDTKYAQQDLATANGSGNIDQSALAHILDRAEATNLAAKKYASGYNALQNKVGKDSAYLNHDNYKQKFSQSYDPVAFIIQSTNRSNKTPQQKQETINYYLDQLSDQQKTDLIANQKALKRLERGDY